MVVVDVVLSSPTVGEDNVIGAFDGDEVTGARVGDEVVGFLLDRPLDGASVGDFVVIGALVGWAVGPLVGGLDPRRRHLFL